MSMNMSPAPPRKTAKQRAEEEAAQLRKLRNGALGLTAAVAAASVGVAGFFALRSSSSQATAPQNSTPQRIVIQNPNESGWVAELGAANRPVDQKAINKQYVQIYDAIAKAKKAAAAEHKPLTVLVADAHLYQDALLVQLMVMDACKRLGINTAGIELAEPELNTLLAQTPPLAEAAKKLREKAQKDLKTRHDSLSDLDNPTIDKFFISELFNNDRPFPNNQANAVFEIYAGKLSNMTMKAFDPLHGETEVYSEPMTSDPNLIRREQAMVDSVLKTAENCVGIFGSFHISKICEDLKSQRRVLVIDGSNVGVGGDWDPTFIERQKALEQCRDLNIVVEGAHIGSAGEALARAHIASLTHQGINPVLFTEDNQPVTLMANIQEIYDTRRAKLRTKPVSPAGR
jgi:hypothetical protein